ncbi:MAG: hypothetical protein GY822_13470 [Deltaproteobacteria bacterium]|nr:hypothetical protein [Deltaproteobacteria bacterium]
MAPVSTLVGRTTRAPVADGDTMGEKHAAKKRIATESRRKTRKLFFGDNTKVVIERA